MLSTLDSAYLLGSAKNSWTSFTDAAAVAPSTPCASAAFAVATLSFHSFSAFSIAIAAILVACATLALLNSANWLALYIVFPLFVRSWSAAPCGEILCFPSPRLVALRGSGGSLDPPDGGKCCTAQFPL